MSAKWKLPALVIATACVVVAAVYTMYNQAKQNEESIKKDNKMHEVQITISYDDTKKI